MIRLITPAMLLLFFLPVTAFGQIHPSPPVDGDVAILIDRYMYVDDLQYPFTIPGMRMYLTDIQLDNPVLYDTLNPILQDLEGKHDTAVGVQVGCIIGGGALVAAGLIMAFSTFGDFDNDIHLMPYVLGGAGMLVFGAGLLISISLEPKPEEYHRFVNKHNKLNPEHPIKVR